MRQTVAFVLLCGSVAAQPQPASMLLGANGTTFYVHQRVTVTLSIQIDKRFVRENLVQPFHRKLDLPVPVRAPFFEKATVTGADDELDTFALNQEVHHGTRFESARRVGVVIRKTVFPHKSGPLRITAPELTLTFATNFREDFLNGRMPVDKQERKVLGPELVLDILPLPEKNRPANFGGAVGRFRATAAVDRQRVTVGHSFKVVLTIEGEGNLQQFAAPKLMIEGFHLRGRVENKTETARRITYDVAPWSREATQIPAIEFAFFDPIAKRYVTTKTAPIALQFAADATEQPRKPEASAIAKLRSTGWRLPRLLPWVALVGPWLLALALLWWRKTRPPPKTPAPAPPIDPAVTFEATVDINPASAFATYLGARLGCAPAAVVRDDLEERLVSAGVPAELARDATAHMDALHTTRFGKHKGKDGVAQARELFATMEAIR